MIAYALNGVISSRLIKKNCEACKEEYTPASEFCAYFGIDPNKHTFIRGKGCSACNYTGSLGRTGIFEVLEFDSAIRTMIVDGASINELQVAAEKNGQETLRTDALKKILDGTVTIENAAHAI